MVKWKAHRTKFRSQKFTSHHNKYDQVYKKPRHELVNEPKKQPNKRFLGSDLALKIIIDCRTDKSCNLKINFRFKLHDVINTKNQTVLNQYKIYLKERIANSILYSRLQNWSLLS